MLIKFTETGLRRSARSRRPLLDFILLLSSVAILVVSPAMGEPPKSTVARGEHKLQSPRPANVPAELQSRLQTLEAAKQSGDSIAVANASRSVVGFGLRESGRIDLIQGLAPAAIEAYRRSIDFDDSPGTRIDLAEAYLRELRFDDSLKQLTEVLVANPDDARAWYVHGELWIMKSKYDEAVKSFNHVLNLQRDPAASYLLGAALLQLGQSAGAKAEFGKLKPEMANRARVHLALADAYRAANYTNDYMSEVRQAGPGARANAHKSSDMGSVIAQAAIFGSSFEPARPSSQDRAQMDALRVKLRTVLASALNDLGTAEARQEKYDLALAHFHEAATWDPDVPNLMRNTGIAAGRAQEHQECVRALRPVVAKNPNDNVARAMLATALFATHSYGEAAEAFAPLGDSALQVPEIAYSWAASLVQNNKYSAASELLNKLERQQLSTEALILVAQLWAQMGNYEHTVQICHRAVNVDPKLLRAHYIAGQALLRLDRPGEAEQELRKELQLDPDNPDVQYHLAFSLLQQSQTEPALELLKSVVVRKPDHPEANYELGKELLQEGKASESIVYLEAAVRLKPQFEPAHYQLQSAYRALGRKEDSDREAKVYRALKAKSRNITLPPPPQSNSAIESPH